MSPTGTVNYCQCDYEPHSIKAKLIAAIDDAKWADVAALFRDAPSKLHADKDTALAAVAKSWLAFQYASDAIRGDRDFIMIAVNAHGTGKYNCTSYSRCTRLTSTHHSPLSHNYSFSFWYHHWPVATCTVPSSGAGAGRPYIRVLPSSKLHVPGTQTSQSVEQVHCSLTQPH